MKRFFLLFFLSSIISAQVIVTERFIGNTYDVTKWQKYNATSPARITFVNEHAAGTGGADGYPWYYDRLGIKTVSDSTSDIDFQGRYWKAVGGNTSGLSGLMIMPDNSTTSYIQFGNSVYIDGRIGMMVKIAGITVYNADTGITTVSDSNRVYRITYTRSTNEVKFYYKADTNAVSWTQTGTTQIANFGVQKLVPAIFFATGSFARIHYFDNLYLNYKPLGYIAPGSIAFIPPPDSVSVGTKNANMLFRWTTNKDTTKLYHKGINILTTIDTTWTLTTGKMDSLNLSGSETFTIKTVEYGSVADSDKVVVYFPTDEGFGVIRPITTSAPNITFRDNTSSANVPIKFSSYYIDSIKVFYRTNATDTWKYLYKVHIANKLIETTTDTSFNLPNTRDFGKLYVRLEEDKDTTKYGLQLTNLLNVNLAPSVNGGTKWWGWEGSTIVSNQDYTSGWVASYKNRVHTTVNVALTPLGNNWTPGVTIDTTTTTHANPIAYDEIWANAHKITGTLPTFIIHKNRRYTFTGNASTNTCIITMEDLINNISYQVFSYPGTGSPTFDFDNMAFKVTADSNGFMLYNSYNSSQGFRKLDTLTQTYTTVYYNMLVGNSNAMLFGGLPEPPLGFAWAEFNFTGGNITVISNRFRGIHPKIWKYGQADGVKR